MKFIFHRSQGDRVIMVWDTVETKDWLADFRYKQKYLIWAEIIYDKE